MKLILQTANIVGDEKNCLYPNRAEVTSAEELQEAVKMDHVCAEYDNDYRSKENFRQSNVLVMDCDNDHTENPAEWITPEKLDEMMPDISYAIAFSRHHMLEKNGKAPRPKFHVYFEIEPTQDADYYAALKEAIYRKYTFFDDNALDAALRSAMADFRVVWFERMMTWHGKHFDIIKAKTPEMKERRERIRRLVQYFDRYWTSNKHRRTINFLERKQAICNEIISDEVNRYDNRDAYLADMKKELERSWERGIVNLTKKCQVYGVDQSKVSTCAPNMTSKGFEVIIQDGKPRVIHARIIWAAEYSDIVEPHIRYIVTERTVK